MEKKILSILLVFSGAFGYVTVGRNVCLDNNTVEQNIVKPEQYTDENMQNIHMLELVVPKNRDALTKSFAYKEIANVFSEIYTANYWCGYKSRSGQGSSLKTTEVVRHELSHLCKELKIQSVLDIGCGDFYWMRTVDLQGAYYIGLDIVPEMIEKNRRAYSDAEHAFLCLNSAEGPLPKVDLVICRDVLMHLSYSTVCNVLRNIKASGSKFVLMTTHLNATRNNNITCGEHYPYNLTLSPYNLSEPLILIEETCAEAATRPQGKALGLWLVDEIDVENFEY